MKSVITLGLLLLLIMFSCMFDEIESNKGVATATITSFTKDYREWAFYLNYTYEINKHVYNGESSRKVPGKYRDVYINKSFPIVYSVKNPHKSILLVTPRDFERWGMQFPDSLYWVRKSGGLRNL